MKHAARTDCLLFADYCTAINEAVRKEVGAVADVFPSRQPFHAEAPESYTLASLAELHVLAAHTVWTPAQLEKVNACERAIGRPLTPEQAPVVEGNFARGMWVGFGLSAMIWGALIGLWRFVSEHGWKFAW